MRRVFFAASVLLTVLACAAPARAGPAPARGSRHDNTQHPHVIAAGQFALFLAPDGSPRRGWWQRTFGN